MHCQLRATLSEHDGADRVPLDKPIPAHLLGSTWAQGWERIYHLMEPFPGVSDLDVSSTLVKEAYAPEQMMKSAENFYVSMGFEPLPDTFWERSQFRKPQDREVQCHASAWGLYEKAASKRGLFSIRANLRTIGVYLIDPRHSSTLISATSQYLLWLGGQIGKVTWRAVHHDGL